jgi:hypothetical protein
MSSHVMSLVWRNSASGDPLGAMGDLGWYTSRIGIVAFSQGRDYEAIARPRSVVAVCNQWTADGQVPLDCEARVSFGPGWSKYLRFDCSFLVPFR